MTAVVPTAEFASLVYGAERVPLDDPAEAFHEASRLYPNVAPDRLPTLLALQRSAALQQTTLRASRTHPHRERVALPRPKLPRDRLRDVLARRRSGRPAGRRRLSLDQLAAVLLSAYGTVPSTAGPPRRFVPSGGALYPLELYVLSLRIEGLGRASFHYDPFRHRLESLRLIEHEEIAAALVDPTIAGDAAGLVVVTAMFWRTRFKYGQRGYRFALLEAGHVAQTAMLTATALGLSVLPLGGYYDRRLDALVGADGLDETSVYALVLGGRR